MSSACRTVSRHPKPTSAGRLLCLPSITSRVLLTILVRGSPTSSEYLVRIINVGRKTFTEISLIVNVASECGFTDRHYKQLVKAQDIFGKTGKFTVLAFPCNQFGGQEPKDNADILKFAQTKYGANFPIFAKTNVKTDQVPDLWKHITEQSGITPDWNFYKFLVDQDGVVLTGWGPWSDVEEIWGDIRMAISNAATAADDDKPGPPQHDSAAPISKSKSSGKKPAAKPPQTKGQTSKPTARAPESLNPPPPSDVNPPRTKPTNVKPPQPAPPRHDDL